VAGRGSLERSADRQCAPSPGEHTEPIRLSDYLVGDLMTENVVYVPVDAEIKEIAQTLASARISAVPVLDLTDRVVGVVSESDLLAKVVIAGDLDAFVHGVHTSRRDLRHKGEAETAAGLMSAPAITVSPTTTIVEAARRAARARVRRLPVVDVDGRLLGIIARADMIRVFLTSDADIRKAIVDEVILHESALDPTGVEVSVDGGVVTLRGELSQRSLIGSVVAATRRVAGVVAVHNCLTYHVDDTMTEPLRVPLY
jgi:CBS domain-containing protein